MNVEAAEVAGEWRIFLDALGRREGDSGILPAVGLIGCDFETEEDDLAGDVRLYYLFESGGADFLFEDGFLDTIFLYLDPAAVEPSYAPYPRPEALFEGLGAGFTTDDLIGVLGRPEASGEDGDRSWHRFAVDGKFVHVEVGATDGPVQRLTFMVSTP